MWSSSSNARRAAFGSIARRIHGHHRLGLRARGLEHAAAGDVRVPRENGFRFVKCARIVASITRHARGDEECGGKSAIKDFVNHRAVSPLPR